MQEAAGEPGSWEDVIAEHPKDLLQWAAALAGDVMIVCYLRDVVSRLQLRSLASGKLTKVSSFAVLILCLPGMQLTLGQLDTTWGIRQITNGYCLVARP